MHGAYAHTLQERTSVATLPQTVERLVVTAVGAAARRWPPAIELRPSATKAEMIERPVRVGESPDQHVILRWLGDRVAEFEAWGGLRTFGHREELALVDDGGRETRGGSCPGKSRTTAT